MFLTTRGGGAAQRATASAGGRPGVRRPWRRGCRGGLRRPARLGGAARRSARAGGSGGRAVGGGLRRGRGGLRRRLRRRPGCAAGAARPCAGAAASRSAAADRAAGPVVGEEVVPGLVDAGRVGEVLLVHLLDEPLVGAESRHRGRGAEEGRDELTLDTGSSFSSAAFCAVAWCRAVGRHGGLARSPPPTGLPGR